MAGFPPSGGGTGTIPDNSILEPKYGDNSVSLRALALGTTGSFITYDESRNAVETDTVSTSADLFFDSLDARFTAELGLPDVQGWTSTNSSLFDDTIFGKEKKSVKFLTGSASKVLTGADWGYILYNGASYGGTIRFESNTSNNSLLSGFGFSAANDPRTSSNIRGRILPRILIDATYTIINYEGTPDVILNGQNGVPLVMRNEFFNLEVKVNPTPDGGVSFGAIDVYVNGVLISTGVTNTSSNDSVSNVVKISRWSGTGAVTYYIGNFGLTIYKEPNTKMIATESMATATIKLIIPYGIREYEVILPDNSPRPIGGVFEIVANNMGGSITLRTQDLNAPQVLFNSLASYTFNIEDKETITFTNIVDEGNVYQGTIHTEMTPGALSKLNIYLPFASPYSTPVFTANTRTKLLIPDFTDVKLAQDFTLDAINGRWFLDDTTAVDRWFTAIMTVNIDINLSVVWDTKFYLYKNGVFESGFYGLCESDNSITGNMSISGAISLSNGDYIDVYAETTVGGLTIHFNRFSITMNEMS